MNQTVSYDVFDTVMTRTFAHPRDLFVRLGEICTDRLSGLTPLAFAAARWQAELAAREKAEHSEVQLDAIYQTLAAALGWDEMTAQHVKASELALESRHVRAVPGMREEVDRARSHARCILFLSDMYLSSAVLTEWLTRLGIMTATDRVFTSGEMSGNKYSGRLFESAARASGGNFQEWHHSGDHPLADVATPQRLGIATSHHTRVHLNERERRVRGTAGEFASSWRSLLAGAMRLARLETPATAAAREKVLWEIGATVAGPLFYGFVQWVLREASRRGLRRLYFLARDGQIFWRIAQLIQSGQPDAIDCRYLAVSRLVLAGATEQDSPVDLAELVAPTGHFHSIRSALVALGIEAGELKLPPQFSRIDLDENLAPPDRAALGNWLGHADQSAIRNAAIARRQSTTLAYLHENGLGDELAWGIVDTGWLGSSQKNLERMLGAADRPKPLIGFYLGLLPSRPPHACGEMYGFSNRFAPLPLVRDESHKVLLELMAQSDHGQVAGYQNSNRRWQPVLRETGPVNLREVRLFHSAILEFSRRAYEVADEVVAPEPEFYRTVLVNYHAFHQQPSRAEAEVFGFMPHAEQLVERNYAAVCGRLSLRQALVALWAHRSRPPHWWLGGQAALGHAWLLRPFVRARTLSWRLRGETGPPTFAE